ncbi:MAG TPA: putative porin [Smithella sp.]|nr:putative porin [Smithella sp.]
MKRHEATIGFAPLKKFGICVRLSMCLLLILLFSGCAAPKPIIIKNHPEEPPKKSFFSSIWPIKHKQEEPPQKSAAGLHQEDQKAAASSDMADLLTLLRTKNVISEDDANQLARKYGIMLPAVKNDNSGAGKNDNGNAEGAAVNKTDESPESNPEPLANSTKEESSEEIKKSDKEQKGEVPANLPTNPDEEMKKDTSGSSINGKQKDVSSDDAKNSEKQNGKMQASPDDEMKKDSSGSAVNDEQKDVSPEDTKGGKGQNEKTQASPDEETKKDISDSAGNEAQKDLSSAGAKSSEEQIEKTQPGANEEIKKDVQEQIKNQVHEEVSREVKKLDLAAELPEWIKKIRFGGDLRLRYEHDGFDQNNGYYMKSDWSSQMNTTTSHDYLRYRARVGMDVPVNDKVDAVIRLATGNDNNPVSTVNTFGDYMNEDKVYFDLAYLKWRPCNFFTLTGGRMPNPWFYSDLVWSPNLNFEGLAANLNVPVTELWTTSLTAGVFPLQQNDFFERSKYLAAGQLVVERKKQKGISTKIGAAYYDYNNITGEVNTTAYPDLNDWTAPLYMQKGNTLMNISISSTPKTALAAEFREFNVTANLDIGFWDPVHVVFLGDYVRNLGFDMSDVVQRTGLPNAGDIDGYQAGVSVGYPVIQEFGQWKAYLYYKFLGADAVVDAFTDPDFHLGGTDAKGWILGADFGLAKNTWLTARWLSADEIHGNQGSQFGVPLAIDVLQVDLNVRF